MAAGTILRLTFLFCILLDCVIVGPLFSLADEPERQDIPASDLTLKRVWRSLASDADSIVAMGRWVYRAARIAEANRIPRRFAALRSGRLGEKNHRRIRGIQMQHVVL